MEEFILSNEDEIINLYKGSLAVWSHRLDLFTKDSRAIPQLCIHEVIEEEDHSLVIELPRQVHDDIFWCWPIARYIKERIIKRAYLLPETLDFSCNRCQVSLDLLDWMCEVCDYDLCMSCSDERKTHSHPMWQFKGYYGLNTHERKNIIKTIQK